MTAATITPPPVLRDDQAQALNKREFEGTHSLRIQPLTGEISFTPLPPRLPPLESESPDPEIDCPGYDLAPGGQLGLLNVLISRKTAKTRVQRGFRGLRKKGKELIKGGMRLIFDHSKAKKLTPVFLTLTVPTRFADGSPLNKADEHLLMAEWSQVTKRFFEELGRELERVELPTRFIYVTELQERFLPHVHAVFPNKYLNRSGWRIHFSKTDEIWGRVLSNILGKQVDVTSANRLEPIHGLTKLADYMTKFDKLAGYLNKGSGVLAAAKAAGVPIPKSWCGSDLQTKQDVSNSVLTVKLESTNISDFEDAISNIEEGLGKPLFSKPFRVIKDDVPWFVSVTCRIKKLGDIDYALSHLLPVLCDSG